MWILVAAAPEAPAQTRPEEIGRLTDAFLESFNRDLAGGDVEAWLSHWADDAVRASSTQTWNGKGQIRSAYVEVLRTWSDPRLTGERRRVIQGNTVAWEGEFAATFEQNGRPVRVPIAIFLAFNGAGRVQSARFYLDTRYLIDQIEGRARP
ncbi:MAG: nuclear transport factor 2 family protein [bacterium]